MCKTNDYENRPPIFAKFPNDSFIFLLVDGFHNFNYICFEIRSIDTSLVEKLLRRRFKYLEAEKQSQENMFSQT